jgi:hypothetical protein
MKPLVQPGTAARGAFDCFPEGMEMFAASSRKAIAFAGRRGSGPALGPKNEFTGL